MSTLLYVWKWTHYMFQANTIKRNTLLNQEILLVVTTRDTGECYILWNPKCSRYQETLQFVEFEVFQLPGNVTFCGIGSVPDTRECYILWNPKCSRYWGMLHFVESEVFH